MSNISLEKGLTFRPLDIQLKLAVNNLFNEDYLSVLAHPMPGINFEFFISLTPKFSKGSAIYIGHDHHSELQSPYTGEPLEEEWEEEFGDLTLHNVNTLLFYIF